MPVGVVDLFQVVKVDHHHGVSIACTRFQNALHAAAQAAAVIKPGQRIGVTLRFDLHAALHLLRHVVHHAENTALLVRFLQLYVAVRLARNAVYVALADHAAAAQLLDECIQMHAVTGVVRRLLIRPPKNLWDTLRAIHLLHAVAVLVHADVHFRAAQNV